MKRYEKNPRYIEFRGKPILVVGSAEHYGAVLNTDFDFGPYLKAMAADKLNQCRVFSGTYRELPGEFEIAENLLAPHPEAFLCPWKKEGEKWNLEKWDEAYWKRLQKFVREAGKKRILVEYVLFCTWYNDALWKASPLHPSNNTQNVGPQDKSAVYSPTPNALWPYLEAFVKKATEVLKPFDNVYFELINEPYFDSPYEKISVFQGRVAEVLQSVAPEKLVALNFSNRTGAIPSLHPHIGIVNFHYAIPEAVYLNAHLGVVLADDETGFAGQSAEPYRREAWNFLMSGGAMFSHLDYSFTLAHPDGTAPITGKTPGSGSPELRRQLGFLRAFLEKAAPWALAPHKATMPTLADAERGFYVAYFEKKERVELAAPAGKYTQRWFDTVACQELSTEALVHAGGMLTLTPPSAEAALTLTRRKS